MSLIARVVKLGAVVDQNDRSPLSGARGSKSTSRSLSLSLSLVPSDAASRFCVSSAHAQRVTLEDGTGAIEVNLFVKASRTDWLPNREIVGKVVLMRGIKPSTVSISWAALDRNRGYSSPG